ADGQAVSIAIVGNPGESRGSLVVPNTYATDFWLGGIRGEKLSSVIGGGLVVSGDKAVKRMTHLTVWSRDFSGAPWKVNGFGPERLGDRGE
ncbi:MAG: hypothetical protein ACQKBU_04990, partial [Verrucomicrobiales bacterium]